MRILMAVLFLAACSKSEKAAKPASECGAAVQRGVDATIAKRRANTTQELTPEEKEVPVKLKAALEKTCVDDKWAPEVIECFKTAADIATCKEKLTPEQRAAYTRAAMGVMMQGKGMPPGGMPPHGMPPGGGSAPPTPPSPPVPPSEPPAGSADGSGAK